MSRFLSLGLRALERTGAGSILERLTSDWRARRAQAMTQSAPGVRFGTQAVVHNGQGDRSRIRIGADSRIDGELLVHDYGGSITVGASSYVGPGTRIWSGDQLTIGSHVFIAHQVTITDTNAHSLDPEERVAEYQKRVVRGEFFGRGSIETAPVHIHDHAWINFGAGVLKGVTIGERSIVGAMSLVLQDVPPDVLVAGVPARIIKRLR